MRNNRKLFWLSFFIAAIAVLFGWAASESAADLRVCRQSVNAINGADALLRIQRISTTTLSRTVRIDYDVTSPDGRVTVNRFAICLFSPHPTPPFKTELSSIETEEGPLPDANLFMLKRFYLDTNEARSDSGSIVPSGGPGFVAHLLEWLLGIAPKAALYALLAGVFTLCLDRLRAMPANAFYAITVAITAAFWALITTGPQSQIATAMALTAGISCGGSTLVLYAESRPLEERTRASSILPWGLFAMLVVTALFWFPEFGMFGHHWLPAWLFAPVNVATVGGYAISAPPAALIAIGLAVLGVPALPSLMTSPESPPQHTAGTRALSGFAGLIACAMAAGIVNAFGYLQFGLAANPLLLSTKAVLIALIAASVVRPVRPVYILLLGLALTTLESALALFLKEAAINATSYILLGFALSFSRRRRPPGSGGNPITRATAVARPAIPPRTLENGRPAPHL